MKRMELVRQINKIAKDAGYTPVWTEGGRHSKVQFGNSTIAVPRHSEINEDTARAILAQARKA